MLNVRYLKAVYWDLFLFVIFINNLHLAIKYLEVNHVADDTNLLNFKRQFHKMAKHTQTIRGQFADELFECVWPICGSST